MADYRDEFWEKYGGLKKDGDHKLLQEMEMSFPNACVKNGTLYIYNDSPDTYKLDQPLRVFLASSTFRDGGVRMIQWQDVLLPFIEVVEEDMSK